MPRIPDLNSVVKKPQRGLLFSSSVWSEFVKALRGLPDDPQDQKNLEFNKFFENFPGPHCDWTRLVLALSRRKLRPTLTSELQDIRDSIKGLYNEAESNLECLRFYMFTQSVVQIVKNNNLMEDLMNWWDTGLPQTKLYFKLLYPYEDGKLPEVTVSDVEITDPPFVFLIERLMDRDGMNAQGGEWHLKPNADEARVPDCSWSWSFLLRANARRLVSGFGFPSEWKAEWSFLGFLWLLGVFWVLAALLGIVWAVYSRHF